MNYIYQENLNIHSVQDTKYYIPKIEEFHIGFEFEYNDINCEGRSGFHSCIIEDIFTISFPNVKGYYGEDTYKQLFSKILWEINREHIRIKCLDSEDIESLGFNPNLLCAWESRFLLLPFESILTEMGGLVVEDIIYFLYKEKNHDYRYQIHFYDKQNRATPLPLFVGQIKNKSELKRILEQIEIKNAT